MSFVGTSYARMVTCGILILGHAVLQAEEGANPLRYRFEKGQSVVYSVRLEAEFEDYCEVFSGLPRFTVQEVKPKENRLTFRGALEPSQVPKADRQGRHPLYYQSGALSLTGVGFPQTSRSSDVSVDSLGREVARKGSSQLPFLLGNLSELILPPVPEALGEDWTKTREVEIKLSESYLRHPLQRDENSKSLSTSEKFTYHTVKQEGDLVTLQKTYEMSTSQLVKNRPRIEMAGVGHLTFDRQRGVFTSMEHELNLTLRETYVTREIPIKIRCTLLDDAAVTQADQEARRPLNADELEAVLLDLSSKERGLGRILQLQQKAPAQPNPEVGTALAGYLKHTDPNTRYAADR